MNKRGNPEKAVPTVIPRKAHNVSRDEISTSALKVLYRLHKAGHQSFLVGGSVRDALLGLHPKDFDIATDAHPEEIRALFGNCRLIGRRFRLAHIRFGKEIIEVATFRAASIADEGEQADPDHASDHRGRILRDNVYGTIEEDVFRRDFTCNALYYNIADFSIWDFVGGVEDIKRRRLALIGDPDRRFREDPVRMLRAVRFAAKLDFRIDKKVATAIAKDRELLSNVPAARLFDELLKLFQAGQAKKTFELLWKHRLFDPLFPETAAELEKSEAFGRFVKSALINTDKRVAAGKSVTPMFLLGVFFWEPVRRLAEEMRAREKMSESQSLSLAAYEIVGRQQSRISIPRRFATPMRDMLAMQPRLDVMKGKRGLNLLDHRRFRAAYDFLMLRAEAGDVDAETAEFWTRVQKQSAAERRASFQVQESKQRNNRGGRRRRPRRRRGPQAAGQS